MTVLKDETNKPFIHISGTTAEVLGELKAKNIPDTRIINLFYNGTNTSCIYTWKTRA